MRLLFKKKVTVILLMRVTSSTDSPPELELLVPDRIDVTIVVT